MAAFRYLDVEPSHLHIDRRDAILSPSLLFFQHKSDAAAEEAAKAKTKALGRIKAAAAGAQAQKHKFVPFPDYARYV